MKKRIVPQAGAAAPVTGDWLDLDQLAEVELTSEAPDHPIDNALSSTGDGWRAAHPGPQTIRLLFTSPQRIERMRLLFDGGGGTRTQEFALKVTGRSGSQRELVRQQFTFSPGTARQLEEYTVEQSDVTEVELHIIPDISRGAAIASLREWRLS